MSPKSLRLVLALALTCCLCLCSIPTFGQAASTGTVAGIVTDASGAVVPGATVTLTDVSTKNQRTTTSNDTGRYIIPNVTPGRYDITVSKAGFSQAKVSAQTVSIGTVTTENIALAAGAVSTTVEVKTTGTELQTMNATIGNTVTSL